MLVALKSLPDNSNIYVILLVPVDFLIHFEILVPVMIRDFQLYSGHFESYVMRFWNFPRSSGLGGLLWYCTGGGGRGGGGTLLLSVGGEDPCFSLGLPLHPERGTGALLPLPTRLHWEYSGGVGGWGSWQVALLPLDSGEGSSFPLSLLRHHPRGEEGLVTAWVWVEIGDPRGPGLHWHCWGKHYSQAYTKALAPHLVFSDAALLGLGGGLLISGKGWMCWPALSLCEWECLCFCCDVWLEQGRSCLKVFCLAGLPLSGSFDQRQQVFLGALLFVLLGISGLTVSPAPSPEYMRQKPNPGNSPHVVPQIP